MSFIDYTVSEDVSSLIEQKPYTHHNRSLIYGLGTNDHSTSVKVDGKHIKVYRLWHDMFARCYSVSRQKDRPTYIGCTVAEVWHLFSSFEKWFSENYIEGYDLDKDILMPGNLVYGPETCVFVPRALNSLLVDHRAARGAYPLGVCFHKASQKYTASVSTANGPQHLGYFSTPLGAHRAYQIAKANVIATSKADNPRIRAALDKRAAQLRDDHANGRITVKI